jgi:uroporphyrinogen-III synthase
VSVFLGLPMARLIPFYFLVQLAIAAIGPVTSAALREYGIHRIVVAADTTTDAVIGALDAHFTAIAAAQQHAAQQPIAGAKHG